MTTRPRALPAGRGIALLLAPALAAGSAHGAIVSVIPQAFFHAAAPSNVWMGTYGSGQFAHTWNEQQGVSVSSLAVDMLGNPAATNASPQAGFITGTVDSHMIHHELNWVSTGFRTGSITFNNPIVGVIYSFQRLNATDSIFRPANTTYSSANVRGYNTFFGFVAVNGATLTFSLPVFQQSLADYDEIRVLTAPAPTPGSASLLALAAAVAARRKRLRPLSHKEAGRDVPGPS